MHVPARYESWHLVSVLGPLHCIRYSVMDHLVKNKLLSEKKYGFIPKRSTVLQLLKVLDDWTDLVDRGIQVDSLS